MPGKGDRRIWTRYTDLEPSAGKITRFLKAAESIGDDKRQRFKDEEKFPLLLVISGHHLTEAVPQLKNCSPTPQL